MINKQDVLINFIIILKQSTFLNSRKADSLLLKLLIGQMMTDLSGEE